MDEAEDMEVDGADTAGGAGTVDSSSNKASAGRGMADNRDLAEMGMGEDEDEVMASAEGIRVDRRTRGNNDAPVLPDQKTRREARIGIH